MARTALVTGGSGYIGGYDFSPSLEAMKKMLEGSFPGIPDFGFGAVDVRDVADLHVRALNAPGLAMSEIWMPRTRKISSVGCRARQRT